MAIFSVDTEAVAHATATARATADRLQSEAALLTAQLRDLQGSWQGSAASAFTATFEQWQSAYTHVEQALLALGTALGNAGNLYADAEQLNLSLFR